MDYFNDIWFRSVSKMITSRNGTRSAALYGAIGIMAGGKAILCIGNGEFELEAPFLYWSYPGESYCWKTPPGEIRENLWVSASGTRFERMLGALDRISPHRRYLFLKKTEMLINTFERMRECFERDTAFHRRRLPLYLEELMVHLADALETNELVSSRMEKAVMHLTTRIVRSPAAALDLEQEAAKYAVSADYLRHCSLCACHTPAAGNGTSRRRNRRPLRLSRPQTLHTVHPETIRVCAAGFQEIHVGAENMRGAFRQNGKRRLRSYSITERDL